MSLTNRVCLFFLTALAVFLASYSFVFYSVTREHIHAQFENELQSILSSLIAAAEVEETEVKWQPLEHSIDFGIHDEFGEVQWVVVGDQNLIVERSRHADDAFLEVALAKMAAKPSHNPTIVTLNGSDRLTIKSQQLSAPRPLQVGRELDEFDTLAVFVSRSTRQRDAILFRLLLLVTLLPLLAWSIAALLGRWFVRKALQPVSDMAQQAQGIAGHDFQTRLTHRHTQDELEGMTTAFNQLLDRQQVAFEQQRRFAGDAAHELRTPLTVLLGQIDVTLRRPRTESEYQSNLELLRTQTQSLQEIVESLLFLARSAADTTILALRSLNLPEWIETQAAIWTKHPRATDLQLDVRIDPSTSVRATPALLGRVVDNLVLNALKYSDPGTPVVLRTIMIDREVIIQVIDSGPGINEADQSQLFEPFFRSDDARRRGIAGTGLGLAIADRIATLLGGHMECQSELGKGSCFTLRLPSDLE